MTVHVEVRVSTEEQRRFGWSSIQQVEEAKRWCAFKGLPDPIIYDDSGWSGGEKDRPGLNRLRKAVVRGDWVIFTKVDRGFRDVPDLYEFLAEMESKGVAVRFLEFGDLDPFTPNGKRIVGMTGVTAQGTREDISVNTARGLRQAAQQHVHVGRKPWQFEFVDRDGRRYVEPTEQALSLVTLRLSVAAETARVQPYKIVRLREMVRRWEATKPWLASNHPERGERRHPKEYYRRYRRKKIAV